MVIRNTAAKASRPALPDKREKKVEILCRTQKEIPRQFIVSALNATNYHVVTAFELLELLFGDTDDGFPSSWDMNNVVDLPEEGNDGRNSVGTNEVRAKEREETKFQIQVYTTFITLRIFFPEVSFEVHIFSIYLQAHSTSLFKANSMISLLSAATILAN